MAVTPRRAMLALSVCAALFAGSAAPALAAEDDDEPVNPARVSILMPLTVPVTTDTIVSQGRTHVGSFLSSETLEEYTSPGGALSNELDAVINRGVTLGIDPMVLASIRRLGSTAPQPAVDWLERLSAATNDTFSLAYADSDITAALQAGRDEVLGTGSLDYAIDPALFAPVDAGSTDDPDATNPPESPLPPLPTSADLTRWQDTIPSVAWPQTDTVIESDLASIEASGFETTILASKNVSRSNKANASATVDGYPTLVVDETISSLLVSTLGAETEKAWDTSVAALEAAIESYAQRGLGTSLVLSLERTERIPTQRLSQTIDAIDELLEADVVPLHEIAAIAPTKATVIDQPQSATRINRVNDLLVSQARDRQFARIADTPTLITGERRARLLVTLSPAARLHAGGWGAATEEFLVESRELRESVELLPSSGIGFFSDRNAIPIYVNNSLPYDVTVFVTVRPALPLVAVDDDRVEVTIKAGSPAVATQTKANVPMRALSNGEVDLSVSLHTDVDLKTRVGEVQHVSMNVQAGWEGPVTIVAAILVFLLFAFGIFRTIVRRRAANRLDAAEHPEVE